MQVKIYIKIFFIVSGAVIAGFFVLQAIILRLAGHWINAGTELNTVQRVLIGLAAFWSRFWWPALVLILIGVSLLVAVIAFLQRASANKVLDPRA